jgi:hypothetical protein
MTIRSLVAYLMLDALISGQIAPGNMAKYCMIQKGKNRSLNALGSVLAS